MAPNIRFKLLIGLLIITTTLAVIGFMPQKVDKAVVNKTENEDAKTNVIKAQLWDNYVHLIKDEGRQISDSITVRDTADVKYSIKQLLNRKYKLIFRYSLLDCEVCVDTVMKKMDLYSKRHGLKDILVLTDAFNQRDFYIRATYYKYPFPLYNLNRVNLGMSIEDKDFPYLFVLTPELRVIKVFIPAKELAAQIDDYLSYVTDYLKTVND